MKFGVGSFVRYKAPTGSTGRVTRINWNNDPGQVLVDWVFGRDIKGDVIRSRNSVQNVNELMRIPRKEYQRIRDGKAFGR